MKVLAVATPALVAAVLSVSGCAPAGKIFNDLDGNGKVSAGEKALQSYSPTVASSKGTLASAESKGIEGFGSGTLSSNAAADVTGTFLTGKIQTTADGLKVTVDGHDYFMPTYASAQTTTLNGQTVRVALFGKVKTVNGVPVVKGDVAAKLDMGDASLTMFVKNYAATYDSGQSIYNYTYDGYAIIAAGRETSAGHLPTAIAEYKGGWFLISGLGGNSASSSSIGTNGGDFTAEVDFNKKTIDALAKDYYGATAATATGTLSGNKFTATATGSGFNGQIIGGFYGTSAQQIAGVGHGKANGENAELGFIGNKQ